MKEKTSAMRCLKCGKVLAILGEMQEGSEVYGIDKDTNNRFHNDKNDIYITCKFCGAKNAMIRDNSKPGLQQLRLSHLLD